MPSKIQFLSGLYFIVLSFQYLQCLSSELRGYEIYDVKPKSKKQAYYLHNLTTKRGYEVLLVPKYLKETTKIAVSPNNQHRFESDLKSGLIGYQASLPNMTDILRQALSHDVMYPALSKGYVKFDRYLRYTEINDYLRRLAKDYPKLVKIRTPGISYEGRGINALHISFGKSAKSVIVITAGMHAREWSSVACALYIIYKMVEKTNETDSFLKVFDWIILPETNPDGYEYTHTDNPLWRKTRSLQKNNCKGVDMNRNFGFHWGEKGISNDPCSDTFRGGKALSESESRTIANVLSSVKGKCSFYLDLHSYGKYIIMPWGYTSEPNPHYKRLKAVAMAGVNAIRGAYGTAFFAGTYSETLYPVAGSAIDYAMGVSGVPFSMILEARSASTDEFRPPPEEIQEIVDETWAGVKAMIKKHGILSGYLRSLGRLSDSILYSQFLLIHIFSKIFLRVFRMG